MTWRSIGPARVIILPILAVLASGLAIASCGGAKATDTYEFADQRKQEIWLLWGQIREWRREAGLKGVEPPRRQILEINGTPLSQAKQVCADIEPRTPKCKDVCGLAEAICENAASICRIADELAGDPWAHGKCSSAKASCREAKQECCGCRSKEPEA